MGPNPFGAPNRFVHLSISFANVRWGGTHEDDGAHVPFAEVPPVKPTLVPSSGSGGPPASTGNFPPSGPDPRGRSPGGESEGDGTPFGPLGASRPAERRAEPLSVFVYGPSRPLVGLTLYALAHSTNPDFVWVDVRIPGEEPHRLDPVTLGWVPPDRVVPLDRLEAARANAALSPATISEFLGPEDPATIGAVTEFLRLPEPSQRLLTGLPTGGRPGLVAVSNAQRLIAAYDPARTGAILATHRRAGYSVFVGYADAPGEFRMLFDLVFRLDGESPREWNEATLTCEKGDLTGALRVGHPVRLPKLPFLDAVLSKALPDDGD